MAKRDPLLVWLDGDHIATLSSDGKPAKVWCRYTATALARWPMNTPVLSCALPLSPRKLDASRFFRGVLPEGAHLDALASRAGVAAYDTFALLRRYGRDIAGALVITEGSAPDTRAGDVEPYTADTLAEEVAGLPGQPLAVYDDSELSIAGLQNKLLLVDLGAGVWGRPKHGRPSTHILKVEPRGFAGMAEMEAGCLQLAHAVGLTTVHATTATYADLPCLIVSRFDRECDETGTVLRRIHQEDACQALDTDTEANRRRGKYEHSGGPSFRDVARLLDLHARDARHELTQLIRVAAFTAVIGNADAHGKNLAFIHDHGGTIRLAPLYDLVPTVLWPRLRTAAAMTIGGRNPTDLAKPEMFTIAAFTEEARRWPLDPEIASAAVSELLTELTATVDRLSLPQRLSDLVRSRVEAMSGR